MRITLPDRQAQGPSECAGADPYTMWPDAKGFDECANRGGVRFWRRGSKWGFQLGRCNARADCEIRKITRVGGRYRVHG
jgi:hypothetical protein